MVSYLRYLRFHITKLKSMTGERPRKSGRNIKLQRQQGNRTLNVTLNDKHKRHGSSAKCDVWLGKLPWQQVTWLGVSSWLTPSSSGLTLRSVSSSTSGSLMSAYPNPLLHVHFRNWCDEAHAKTKAFPWSSFKIKATQRELHLFTFTSTAKKT